MRIKLSGRKLLIAAAQADGNFVIASDLTNNYQQRTTNRLTLLRLQSLGLVEVVLQKKPWSYPKVPRITFRLTELGSAFVSIYETELIRCSRIRASKFRKATGIALPWSTEGKAIPAELRANIGRPRKAAQPQQREERVSA